MKKHGNLQTKWQALTFSRLNKPTLITPKKEVYMFGKIFYVGVFVITFLVILALIISAVAGLYIFLGWLFALAVNFICGTTYTMWQGLVAILVLSFIGGLLGLKR